MTSAGDMVGRSRLLGGGKRPEPRGKGESVVLGMIARFNAAIVPRGIERWASARSALRLEPAMMPVTDGKKSANAYRRP